MPSSHDRGTIVALFPGQVLLSHVASTLVGCCYGLLEPSSMAITSRRFVQTIGPVSSLLVISTNATAQLSIVRVLLRKPTTMTGKGSSLAQFFQVPL